MRNLIRPSVWSSAFYLIPGIYAYVNDRWGIAVLCLVVFSFSTLHHWFKSVDQSQWWWQKHIEGTYSLPLSIFDSLFAVALTITTLDYALAVNYDFKHLAALIVSIALSLTFITNRWRIPYGVQHTLWHFFSALAVLIVLL